MGYAPRRAGQKPAQSHTVYQRLAALRPGARGDGQVIDEIFAALRETLDLDLLGLAVLDRHTLRVVRLDASLTVEVREGSPLPFGMADLAGQTDDEQDLAQIERALAALHLDQWLPEAQREGSRTVAVPLYHLNGDFYGALFAMQVGGSARAPLDPTPLHLAGRILLQAIDEEAAEDRARGLLQDLTATAHRTRMVYDALPCGVLVLDAGGMIMEANAAAQRILGLGTHALLGLAPDQILAAPLLREDGTPLPDEARPEVQALETLRPLRSMVCGVPDLGGAARWLQFDALPLVDASGDLESVVLSFFDISERIQAEIARSMSDLRFRALVEHAPVSMCITDEHGILEDVNDAFCALYGYSREELLRRPFTVLLAEERRDGAVQRYQEALHDQVMALSEEEVVTKAGETLTVLSTVVPLPGVVGQRKRATFAVDITLRKRSEQRMRHLAHHDALTGLPNRVLFRERLGRMLVEVQQRHEALAVLFLDLDGFKEVNDTYGHDAGDQLLCAIASCMRRCTRDADVVARLAGDEFTVILHTIASSENAAGVAQKILSEIRAGFPVLGTHMQITASIGISLAPEHGSDPDALLALADAAMYRAKRDGKDTCRVYSAGLPMGQTGAIPAEKPVPAHASPVRARRDPNLPSGRVRVQCV